MGRIGEPEDIANAVAFLSVARVRLDHCANIDRGRRPNGLHWTCVVVVSASPLTLDALVCAPSILSERHPEM